MMADVPPDEIVERALAFVAEFKGDGRCALNCFYSEALAAEVLRLRSVAAQGEPLTAEDREQIAEGIEHFIIGVVDPDPVVAAIWQPYIDKLWNRSAAVDPPPAFKDARERGNDLALEFLRKFPTVNLGSAGHRDLGAWFHTAMQIGAEIYEESLVAAVDPPPDTEDDHAR